MRFNGCVLPELHLVSKVLVVQGNIGNEHLLGSSNSFEDLAFERG